MYGDSGSPSCRVRSRKLDVLAASFDLVAMTEYLEHEPRPSEGARRAPRVVKPGGFFAIEVPDITGPPGRWFGDDWWQLDAPRHVTFFSPQTLTLMLQECGFDVLRVKRYGLLMSMGYSLLQALGFHYFGSNKLAYLTLSAVLGLPSLPSCALTRLHDGGGAFSALTRAPPGTSQKSLNVVQDGVAWFSDPGQGGPPDNQLRDSDHRHGRRPRGRFHRRCFGCRTRSP